MAMGDGHPRAALIVGGARAQMGWRFRPQGRGAEGVDCLGLVILAAQAAGIRVDMHRDLPLRGLRQGEVHLLMGVAGCSWRALDAARPGDVLQRVPATRQIHLAIRTEFGLVEAHAGLRRVVERPLGLGEIWHAAWRLPMGDG